MDKMNLPQHIAIIMDGNGRWAKKRSLPRIKGHYEGAKAVRVIVESCAEIGVKYLTLYAFSTENWKRPRVEIRALMALLKRFLKSELKTMMKNNIRFKTIGDIKKLPTDVCNEINSVTEKTALNKGLTLILALSYGSRPEIVKAARSIAKECVEGKINPSAIDESVFERHLDTCDIPDPDLLIRTSGEMRISNFLLWQLSYAEFYITDVLWPDFDKKELKKALREYSKRERRFGETRAKAVNNE